MHWDNPKTSPLRKANGSASGAPPTKAALTVCLVDDDPSVLKAMRRLLVSAGWKAESFTDPSTFLRYAEDFRPRVAVIDILMPLMNGLEVQARLCTVSPSTRVIVLTSQDNPMVRCQALDRGASAFFRKPVGDEEFLAGIHTASLNNGS